MLISSKGIPRIQKINLAIPVMYMPAYFAYTAYYLKFKRVTRVGTSFTQSTRR